MCLGIPVRIISRADDLTAEAEIGNVRRKISIQLLPEVEVGDYVILHTGFAIQKLDEKEAVETLNLISEVYRDEIH